MSTGRRTRVAYDGAMFRRMALTVALITSLAVGARASGVAFPSPDGWSHVAVPTSTDTSRTFDQWHIAGDVSTVTFIRDASGVYADALATIMKNFADNNIKPSANKDLPCQGKTAHMVEFATGPDGKKILINRVLVPETTGLVTITYARSDGADYDKDVKKSLATFCAASPT